MKDYINLIDTSTNYFNNLLSQDAILPSVTFCEDEGKIHYNSDQYLTIVFNISDTTSSKKIMKSATEKQYFSEIWIDDVKLPEVVNSYTFSTTGLHVVKYKLVDPTQIPLETFYQCSLIRSVILPSSIKTLNIRAFYTCNNLQNIYLNKVEVLSPMCFYSCLNNNLNTIILPDTITRIENQVFDFCTNIKSIIITATTPPVLGNNVFTTLVSGFKIYVPADLVSIYKNNTYWQQYKNYITAITE